MTTDLVIYEERPQTEVTITLPDLPGAWITGPGEMENRLYYEIQAKAAKGQVHYDEKNQRNTVVTYYEEYTQAWNLVAYWVSLPDTRWNLADKDQKLLPRTEDTLSKRFKLRHINHMANVLNQKLWSQAGEDEPDKDAEGNAPMPSDAPASEKARSDDSLPLAS